MQKKRRKTRRGKRRNKNRAAEQAEEFLGSTPNPDTKKKLVQFLKARNAALAKQGYNLTDK